MRTCERRWGSPRIHSTICPVIDDRTSSETSTRCCLISALNIRNDERTISSTLKVLIDKLSRPRFALLCVDVRTRSQQDSATRRT